MSTTRKQYNTSEVMNALNLVNKIKMILREGLDDTDWELLEEIGTDDNDLFERIVELAFEIERTY